ncbi:hypothetical protein ACLOJK_027385, partial [Asimina triloba]
EDQTAYGLWDPVAGQVSSRCLRPANVAPPTAVLAAGRYTTEEECALGFLMGEANQGLA